MRISESTCFLYAFKFERLIKKYRGFQSAVALVAVNVKCQKTFRLVLKEVWLQKLDIPVNITYENRKLYCIADCQIVWLLNWKFC